jgi:enterochelin esterase-like enzyme
LSFGVRRSSFFVRRSSFYVRRVRLQPNLMESSMKVALVLSLALLTSSLAAGQDTALTINQAVEREVAPGALHAYGIALDAGDYVAGSIVQEGMPVFASVFLPDGTRLRGLPGPREGKRDFAFIADSAGTYRLELRGPTTAELALSNTPAAVSGKYTLRLTERLALEDRLKPAQQDKYVSPTIDALRQEFARGETSTDAFWKARAAAGTPIVEPVDKEPQRVLVTFLWRGTPSTRNVAVVGSFGARPIGDAAMTRLGTSDVWYLTLRLPAGARFAYRLSPNDPMTFDPPRSAQRMASVQSDPLNPNRWQCSAEASRYECSSMVQLPGAPPQPWIVKNTSTPAGSVDKHRIKSQLLGNERSISVYTPANYRAGGTPYSLLVLFDESAYLDAVPTPVILDNLIAAQKIPPTVAVLIANPSQETRSKELPPNPTFAEFLATELVPWVRARYTVTTDPSQTVIAGSSFGGIAATYAGLRHPELFGNVLCQSGSFWWAPDHDLSQNADATTETGWLAREFIRSPKLPLRFWMDAGVFEVDASGTGGAILEPSRHMRDVLIAKGYEVHYRQYASGHDYLNWRGTLAEGLLALVGTERLTPSSR